MSLAPGTASARVATVLTTINGGDATSGHRATF